MAKKAGRPPGTKNKVGREEKEFLKGLLGETQQQYHDAFIYYAQRSAENEDDRKFFVSLRNDISKLIVPKPVEVDANIEASDFEMLLGMCKKWDDE